MLTISPFLRSAFFFLAFIIMTSFIMIKASFLLIPLTFAILLSTVLNPIEKLFYRFFPIKFLSILFSFLFVVVPLGIIIYVLSTQVFEIFSEFGSIENTTMSGLEEAEEQVEEIVPQELGIDVKKELESITSKGFAFISQGIMDTTSTLFSTALVFLYSYFLLLYKSVIKSFLFNNIEVLKKEELQKVLSQISTMLSSYIAGMGIIILILSTFNIIGFYLIGIKYALFWGIFAGLLAVIPYIGTLLGGLAPFLYILSTYEQSWQPVALVVYMFVVQQVEGNIITPKIVGDKVNINPLIALISLLVFGYLWGVAGVFLALPIASFLRIIFSHFDTTYPFSVLMSARATEKKVKNIRWSRP